MTDLFANIEGQVHATSYLKHAYETGNATHAYLLAGGDPQEAVEIALRFAAALIAEGDEEAFDQAIRRVHPDLHLYAPAGAGSYLVEQIRELTHDAELAPIRSGHKVYIIQDAQRLSGAPANAFLKTLEEPPENVTCILIANSETAVLETLRSRCEVLVLHTASAAAKGNAQVSDMLFMLARGCGNRELLESADRFVELAHAEAQAHTDDAMDAESYIEKYEDYLSQGAKKEIEKQEKREGTARERAALQALLNFAQKWLRDCLAAREGATQLLSYAEYAQQTTQIAQAASIAGLVGAIDAVSNAVTRISYNVTPRLAIEAMFLEIREALCRK